MKKKKKKFFFSFSRFAIFTLEQVAVHGQTILLRQQPVCGGCRRVSFSHVKRKTPKKKKKKKKQKKKKFLSRLRRLSLARTRVERRNTWWKAYILFSKDDAGTQS
jgi:hypothetical protein